MTIGGFAIQLGELRPGPDDAYLAQVIAAMTARPWRDSGVEDDPCPGEGECHGSMKWCAACGDTDEICPEPETCDAHRPPMDEAIDNMIVDRLETKGPLPERQLHYAVDDTISFCGGPGVKAARFAGRLEVVLRRGWVVREEGRMALHPGTAAPLDPALPCRGRRSCGGRVLRTWGEPITRAVCENGHVMIDLSTEEPSR